MLNSWINQTLCGNSIEIMKKFDANSIDSIVTDGPYGWGFMGKEWDKFTAKGYQNFCFEWGSQALRILKPGGYCESFSAPRKYHRMACGLEDAGFKIKDMIDWIYGSGFAKNLNISLAINNYLGGEIKRGKMIVAPDGQSYDKRKKIGKPLTDYCYSGDIIEEEDLYEKLPTNSKALEWYGWGTGLTPAHENIVVAQKPYEKTYAENVLKWGVGGLNIDGCRIDYTPEKETDSRIGTNKTWGGKREASKHTVSLPPVDGILMYKRKGRWPSNLILDPISAKMVDAQSGISGGGSPKHNSEIHRKGFKFKGPFNESTCGFNPNKAKGLANFGDKGGASRFFYCAKAYKTERNAGCEELYWKKENNTFKLISKEIYNSLPKKERAKGNPIGTLKPINLMRYIIRLVCPKGGTVLDLFAGSGTTGIACIIEDMNYILIEKRESFAKKVIPKRLEYWKDPNNWKLLKDHPLLPEIQLKINKKQNKSLDIWI